uniref:Putative peptidase n=1 Tax=viral metagenome TaxID=1070528 RepID=A0A6M3J2R9_9ZZZZ
MWELIRALFQVFKSGNPTGNVPSPRYDIPDDYEFLETTVLNTNSMEPLIDVGHTVLLSDKPEFIDNLKVGDIIIWEIEGRRIIHSVVEVGNDGEWYCRTKGLNLNQRDPDIIRRKDILYAVLGVYWSKSKYSLTAEIGD